MKNAHFRFGWLTYVKVTEKTTTHIKLRLDRFIGELLPDPPRQAKAHLISVIGGDTQIAAISAAISLGDRFMIEGPGVPSVRVCLERNAQVYKGAIQLAGRKKPLRHLIGMSEELASTNSVATSGKTLLVSSEAQFVWSATAHIYGIPGMPEWASWFADELEAHRAIVPAIGVGCSPAVIKATKEQLLDWLSWGVESEAVGVPQELGPVHWPIFKLRDIFLPPA
ncbi:MAG TPA: hypothetical protein VFA90_04235 [Terriglobales bacterium]|nr:hypothetical protein [Terriglobales bacterium]